MRIGRIANGSAAYLARIDGDRAVPVFADAGGPGRDPLREALAQGVDLASAPALGDGIPWKDALLTPVREPQKILAIGLNYADHARETGAKLPEAPIIFVKTANSLADPGSVIRWRGADSKQVDYEAELAVVIGRRARDVSRDDALDHVFGYVCCNDVSARDAQFSDGQWIRAKSFDTFCPLGPWIVTADEIPDPQTLGIRCRVNGEALQDSSTAEMVFGVAELVSYASRFMTLEPGDVITTGTPAGVGVGRKPPVFLADGDVVDVEIDGIGTLSNAVAVE